MGVVTIGNDRITECSTRNTLGLFFFLFWLGSIKVVLGWGWGWGGTCCDDDEDMDVGEDKVGESWSDETVVVGLDFDSPINGC